MLKYSDANAKTEGLYKVPERKRKISQVVRCAGIE